MADPVTMAVISMGATAAAGAVGAYGSMYQGQAQANMYNYQAGIAQMNRQIALQDAAYARSAGEVSAQESGMRTRAQIGATRAAMAAGNLDINRGSAQAVQQSETAIGQQNQAIIRADAAKKAYGFEVESAQDAAQAQIDQYSAATSLTAGKIGAVSSVLGGVAGVSSKWMQYKSTFGQSSPSGVAVS